MLSTERAVQEVIHAQAIIEAMKLSIPLKYLREVIIRLKEMGFTEGVEGPFREQERDAVIREAGRIGPAMDSDALGREGPSMDGKPPQRSRLTQWNYSSYLALNAIYSMLPDDDPYRTIEVHSNSLRELFGLLGRAVSEDLKAVLGNE